MWVVLMSGFPQPETPTEIPPEQESQHLGFQELESEFRVPEPPIHREECPPQALHPVRPLLRAAWARPQEAGGRS